MASTLLFTFVILVLAIAPPLIYLVWVRDAEVCRRESYSSLLRAFLFGGTISIAISYFAELFIVQILYVSGSPLAQGFWKFQPFDPTLQTFLLAVIIAPIVEESAKSLGVLNSYPRLLEVEDGIIYGAAVGLGFAAVENVLYLFSALAGGLDVLLLTAGVRAVTSTLLHASSTAVVGYGIALAKFSRLRGVNKSWLPYLLVAMLMHALFNLFAIMGTLASSNQDLFSLLGLFLAFLLAASAFIYLRHKAKELDRSIPCVPGSQ
jgi:protease PrsW